MLHTQRLRQLDSDGLLDERAICQPLLVGLKTRIVNEQVLSMLATLPEPNSLCTLENALGKLREG